MSLENSILEITEKAAKNRKVQAALAGIGTLSGVFGIAAPTTEAFTANRPLPDSHIRQSEPAVQLGLPTQIGDYAYTLTAVDQNASLSGQEILVPRDEIRIQKREIIIAENGNYTSPMINNEYAVFQEITEQGENGQKTIIKAKKINSPDTKPFVVSDFGTTNRAEGISKNNIVVVS